MPSAVGVTRRALAVAGGRDRSGSVAARRVGPISRQRRSAGDPAAAWRAASGRGGRAQPLLRLGAQGSSRRGARG